jgi:hypothetical protein
MIRRSFVLVIVTTLALAGCSGLQRRQPLAISQGDPLPRSPKGYELYSWYDGGAGEWQYVLITGTNRLKTYEEMVLGESQVAGDGWVRIAVKGTIQLKALLARLPRGEQVAWRGGEWLRRAGQSSGEIRLPPETVIDEIQSYCHRRGVKLEVAD